MLPVGDRAGSRDVAPRSDRTRSFVQGDRILVIANPATRVDTRRVVHILEQEKPVGVMLDVHWSDAPGRAAELTTRHLSGATGVVAVGGDGTVSEVATALRGTNIPLGVLPGGSTNIVARELGLPASLRDAARLIFSAHARHATDVGICNGRVFLHMAGVGFDSRLFDLADPRLKKVVGWVAYLPAAAQALTYPQSIYTIDTDGDVMTTQSPLVLIANGGSIITPWLQLLPGIRSNDGWLDVIVVTATRPHELASVLGRLATMQMDRSPFVVHRRARNITVTSTVDVPVELDGDVVGEMPLHIHIEPAALEFIVPLRR